VRVEANDTKIVSLSRESYYQVYSNKMNQLVHDRKQTLVNNFFAFSSFNDQKIKIVCEVIKSRMMNKGEVLFEDCTRAEMLFFLT